MSDAHDYVRACERSWLPHAIVAIDLALRAGARACTSTAAAPSSTTPSTSGSIARIRRSRRLNQERRLFGSDTWMLATVWMRPDRVDEAGDVSRALTAELERIDGVTPRHLADQPRGAPARRAGSVLRRARRRTGGRSCAKRCCAIRSPASSWSIRSRRTSFSLLIKEHTGTVDAGRRPPAAGRPRSGACSTAIRRSPRRRSPARPSSTPISTACRGATSSCSFPATVVVASLVLLAMLRFRWRTTLAILLPVGLTTAALVAAMLRRRAAVHDGHHRAARAVLHAGHRLEPARRRAGSRAGSTKGAARRRRRRARRRQPARPARSSSPTSRRRSGSACSP